MLFFCLLPTTPTTYYFISNFTITFSEKSATTMNDENIKEHEFKPGQSGNPSGKPLGTKNRSTIARKVLEMRGMLPAEKMEQLKAKFPEITNLMTVEEIMTIVMAENAITGEDKHYRALMDSAYGAPKQEMETTVTLQGFKVKDVLEFDDDQTQP